MCKGLGLVVGSFFIGGALVGRIGIVGKRLVPIRKWWLI